jgi:hypothetical protein
MKVRTMNLCETCVACCVLPPIASIGKAAGRPCVKLYDGTSAVGCSIYGQHPGACRQFRCAWLAEGWPADLRPDLCGVMLTHSRSGAGKTITAWELRPGLIRASWDLWREKATTEPIAIIFADAPPILLGRDGTTYPIQQP